MRERASKVPGVPLPLKPPLAPQLARSRASLPEGEGWAYEPKYDGFRAVAFVDGDETYLQSRNGKPLSRYFPELQFPPGRYVLDGEIVASSFDTLGQRIHPAASRIARLAEETPATYYAFDLLALDDEVLLERSYDERRAALEAHVVAPDRPDRRRAQRARGGALAARGRGRHRQGGRRALPARRAHRHDQDQARAHRRRRRHGLAARQGRAHGRRAHPRALHARRAAARGRALQRLHGQGEARARRLPGALRDRRARQRRGQPLDAKGASWNGSRCGPSWWSRSPSTTSPTGASATAPRSSAGARTRPRRRAPWTSSTSRVGQ